MVLMLGLELFIRFTVNIVLHFGYNYFMVSLSEFKYCTSYFFVFMQLFDLYTRLLLEMLCLCLYFLFVCSVFF